MPTVATLEGLGQQAPALDTFTDWLGQVAQVAPTVPLYVGPEGSARGQAIYVSPEWVTEFHRALGAYLSPRFTWTVTMPTVHGQTAPAIIRKVQSLTSDLADEAALDTRDRGFGGLAAPSWQGSVLGLVVAAGVLVWAARKARSRRLRLALLGAAAGAAGAGVDRKFPGLIGPALGGAGVALLFSAAFAKSSRNLHVGRAALFGAFAGFGGAQVARRLAEAEAGTLNSTLQTAIGSLVGGAAVALTADGLMPPELRLDGEN